MSTAVCLAYSNISDEERDGSSPLHSLLSLKELEWKSCFYKLMSSAAHLNVSEPPSPLQKAARVMRSTLTDYNNLWIFLAV